MRLEVWQHVTDGVPEALDRPLRRFAQERLELCEGILDGVEVRTVGRKVLELSSCHRDELANARALVAREIVHDNDIAGAQFWAEDLLDIGLEGLTVDGAVEYEGRDEASQGQCTDERCRLPMAMGHPNPEPLAPRAPAVAARHVGGSPGLVDKHQTLRREIELSLEPVPAASQDVGTVLLRSMGGLFLRVMPWRAKKR